MPIKLIKQKLGQLINSANKQAKTNWVWKETISIPIGRNLPLSADLLVLIVYILAGCGVILL